MILAIFSATGKGYSGLDKTPQFFLASKPDF
jgi:hypothetical protein